MKIIIMIGIILFIFGFSYLVMRKADSFIRNHKDPEYLKKKGYVRLGLEMKRWHGDASKVIKYCKEVDPDLTIVTSVGRVQKLLKNLLDEKLDLILLSEKSIDFVDKRLNYEPISGYSSKMYFVWKESVVSRDRNKMIAIMETRQGILDRGYCDYMK